jgi:hypothetical protein
MNNLKQITKEANLSMEQFNKLFGYPSSHRDALSNLTDAEFINKRIDEDIDWDSLSEDVSESDFREQIESL